MEKGYLNEVKAILKSLVLSCTDKMTVDKLNRDYRDIEGECIPYRRLGFGNIEQFLRSIPDTLMVFGTGPTAMVCFVANERSGHIHDMIMEQRKPKTRSRRTRSRSRNQFSKSGRSNNKFSNNAPARKLPGQQFSAFQSTNRSHMTKTLTVRDVPPLLSSVNKYPNHRPPCLGTQPVHIGYQLPQPAGINSTNLNSIQSSSHHVPKTVTSKVEKSTTENMHERNQISKVQQEKNKMSKIQQEKSKISKDPQEEINQLPSLLTLSCRVTAGPPAASHAQSPPSLKAVSFSKENKANVSVSENTNNLDGIKRPNGGQTTKILKPKIKLSTDVERLLNMPSRCSLNPILESQESKATDENPINQSAKDIQSKKEISNKESKAFFDLSDEKEDDLDEAVPQFAANNLVYRLDFPEHTVPYGRKIPPYVLADDVYVGSYIRIFVAEIHSPFKFWFHIQRDEHELDILMYQIELFYKSLNADELCIPIACLTPGQTCAACYNDLWHRAEIVAPPVNNKIKVSFVDYGTVSEVDVKMVKFLASSFANLPKQALRGCLSHIKPRFLHWSHEATNYFLSLVLELMLYAKVTEIDRKNQILYMIICNTHGDEVVQINKALVEKRFALLNEDWLESKIKKKNGQRVHHPREDFPTFSMIESGEYPSFAELVNLHERGIDYEAIHDHIIFNNSSILNKHENAPEAIRNLPYFLMTSNPFRLDIIMELNGIRKTEAKYKT